MKFPFFASFIVFIVWLSYEIAKHNRIDADVNREFWRKEHRAGKVSKKPLDNLDYITIPYERLPMQALKDDEQVAEYIETVNSLSDSPIVNFTGITNTDLKLQYGTLNIDRLSRYDQNYTILARTLDRWASYLYKKGCISEARDILEFAVSTKTDVSGTYKLLCQIYKEENTPEKIKPLYHVAESVNSIMKNTIVRILQESEQ
ncbi:MAG: hypothetical protein NC313_10565 [Butyrivibrio sp.]|nr:hypothetical protein [Butyrivibrio sp.]